MRQVEQLDISYTTLESRCSIFVGVCKSQELFEQYWEKDYDLLHNEYIGFEMGVDFGINTYDEDFAIMIWRKNLTAKIDELVEDAEIFDIDALKRLHPDGLDRPYNAIIVLDRVSYDGSIQEVQNETFGYFKFLGVFDSLQ